MTLPYAIIANIILVFGPLAFFMWFGCKQCPPKARRLLTSPKGLPMAVSKNPHKPAAPLCTE